tara:strand:+ start:7747 stop:8349 length:603 start_codon:yes stop_codon:yes gene_type:complete
MKYVYVLVGIIIIALGAISYIMSPTNNANEKDQITTVVEENSPVVVMETSLGTITLGLNATDAPQTVENFVRLASDGYYDGIKFHRVIPGFMIQGGDPLTKDDSMKDRWGTGGPGYTFADEIHVNNQNTTGTIAMANAGPNTNGSQFFINVADNNFLDPKHTVFGEVIEGMEVVTAIENTPTDAQDRPIEPVTIVSVTIQ